MFWPTHTLRSWSPFDELRRLQRDINVLFEGTGLADRSVGDPPVTMHCTKEAVVVSTEVPGVDPKDLELNVQNDTLSISGVRPAEPTDEHHTVHRRERVTGAFSRALQLPCKVDDSKVTASCKNGVLTVTLPRAAEDKPKTITITSA
jgi:HSP20 family protein